MYLDAALVRWRMARAVWPERARRLRERARASRHVLASVLLVTCGLAGALGGGALVGTWCLGLVLIAESAGALWFGLMRDDGRPAPRRGEHTVADVLEEYRRMP